MTDQEKQSVLDEDHLKLLRIGYIVAGAVDGIFALFPLIYVAMGIFIAAGSASESGQRGDLNQSVFGLIMVVFGLLFSFFCAAQAALKFVAARAISRRHSRTLCLVTAGVSCISFPWGTLLGVLTFLVLGRSSVRQLFEPAPAMFPPPARTASSLFEDDEAVRQ